VIARLCERLAARLAARGRYEPIRRLGDGMIYMERYVLLRTRFGGIYLHRFRRSDPDEVHDHPKWNASLVLSGRYEEQYHDGTSKVRRPGSLVLRSPRTLHRIKLFKGVRPQDVIDIVEEAGERARLREADCALPDNPHRARAATEGEVPERLGLLCADLFCWSLWFWGPNVRPWGFMSRKEGWIEWREFERRYRELHPEGVTT